MPLPSPEGHLWLYITIKETWEQRLKHVEEGEKIDQSFIDMVQNFQEGFGNVIPLSPEYWTIRDAFIIATLIERAKHE